MSNMIPCTNPKICGVKSHYPDTQPLCKAGGSTSKSGATISSTPSVSSSAVEKSDEQYMETTVPSMMLDAEIERCAEGIVNGYDNEEEREEFEDALMARIEGLGATTDSECWDAYHAIIANKEMPPRTGGETTKFGGERITRSEINGQPSVRIEAGGHGGHVAELHGYYSEGSDGLHILADRDIEEGLGFDEASCAVYQNSQGELWIASSEIPGHEYGAPMKIEDLKEGDRHWVQDDNDDDDADPTEEHVYYELARRLNANPVTRQYLKDHAPVSDPGIDSRYQREGDNPYFTPKR